MHAVLTTPQSSSTHRQDGYLPIGGYAAIGDGRTAALVGQDGSIDWLCFPNLDSPSLFGAILDAGRGGRFSLAPDAPYRASRRYLPGTNVLETEFETDAGRVRVLDALTIPDGRLDPFRELVRRIEGLSGRVRLSWRAEPRFGYGLAPGRSDWRGGIPIATSGGDAVAVGAWGAGAPEYRNGTIAGTFEIRGGESGVVAMTAAHHEPLIFPSREDVERRLDATTAFWRRWSGALQYDGPWRDAVVRSALALKLLVFAPSGAIAAAATTSLPEEIGGERNWDYRYCWIRDSTFTLAALLRLGCPAEANAFFWWFMHATQITRPRLRVLYRLDGGARAPEIVLPLEGYAGSRPVRIGNAAGGQMQLDVYGNLLDAAWLYASDTRSLDAETGRALAEVADYVCGIWRQPDHSIWEVRLPPRHFIHSKAMCWVALDRAVRLAEAGYLARRRIAYWRSEADAIRAFVESEGWSEEASSYRRMAGSHELDAATLLLPIIGYAAPDAPRVRATVEAVRRELGRGPFILRYAGEDGVSGHEGAFLPCAFWLAHALALGGRDREGADLMDILLEYSNDVGLYAEEIDPSTGAMLGNFPQALVHLSLINAALAFQRKEAV
jgi:GH15 family glucan-1,4-alpha-glucosidase